MRNTESSFVSARKASKAVFQLVTCAALRLGWNDRFVYSATKTKKSKSAITIKLGRLHVATVGKILLEEFLKPLELSQNALARAISVPPRRINEVVLGKRSVTADTDLRLARYFRMSEGFFLRLQIDYDLRIQKRALGDKLKTIMPEAA